MSDRWSCATIRRPSPPPFGHPGALMPSPDLPAVAFTQRRLPNGLRVIVAPDHLAPVVAINLWYDVGSKHEVAGKTGFAHLFEHFMFQGSRRVAKSEHMA